MVTATVMAAMVPKTSSVAIESVKSLPGSQPVVQVVNGAKVRIIIVVVVYLSKQ